MKNKAEKIVLVLAVIAVIATIAVAALYVIPNMQPSQQNIVPVSFNSATGAPYIPLIVSGQGTICATDLTTPTSPAQMCTQSSLNLPVTLNDQVSFQASPSTGFQFGYWSNGQCSICMTNPVTVTVSSSCPYADPNCISSINAQFVSGSIKFVAVPISFSAVGGGGYISIGVLQGSQGMGNMCAQDLSVGQTQATCTQSTSYNFPVSVGDQVTFSANANQGYAFVQFQAAGCNPSPCVGTTNPVTVGIIQQPNGSNGYVNVQFAPSGSTLTNVVTATTGNAASSTTTITSTGSTTTGTASGIVMPPNWFWYMIGGLVFLAIILIVVVAIKRR